MCKEQKAILVFDILFYCRTDIIITISTLNSLKIIINNIIIIILSYQYYLTSCSALSFICIYYYSPLSSYKLHEGRGTSHTFLWIPQQLAQCLLIAGTHIRMNQQTNMHSTNFHLLWVQALYQATWIDMRATHVIHKKLNVHDRIHCSYGKRNLGLEGTWKCWSISLLIEEYHLWYLPSFSTSITIQIQRTNSNSTTLVKLTLTK